MVVAGATMMQLAWEVAEVERRWRGLLAAVAAAVAETQAHRPVEPAGPAVHESLLAAGAMGVAAETCQAASLVVAVAPFLEAASFRVGTAASLPATAVPWSAPLSRSRREARTHTCVCGRVRYVLGNPGLGMNPNGGTTPGGRAMPPGTGGGGGGGITTPEDGGTGPGIDDAAGG